MFNKLLIFSSILLLLVSCKAKVPKDVIERETMESLLYDYHLAQSLAKQTRDSVDYHTRLYTEAVFRKYDVSEDKFNHSMEWYTRNSEELFKIYKRIGKRFDEASTENKVIGNPYASMTAPGDTMNIWTGKSFYLLNSVAKNRLDFELNVDSLFDFGDRLLWEFEASWYYREVQKSGTMVLAMVYDNDSVATTVQSMYTSGKQSISIRAGRRAVKSVHGFVYLSYPWTQQIKLMTISDPVLVRFKKKRTKTAADRLQENGDQVAEQEEEEQNLPRLNTNNLTYRTDAEENDTEENDAEGKRRPTLQKPNPRRISLPK